MEGSEPTASVDSVEEGQRNVFDAWLGLFARGITLQANTTRALTRATIRTGQLFQRQNTALAQAWIRAATNSWGTLTPVTSRRSGRSPTDERRRTADASATTHDIPRSQDAESVDSSFQQTPSQERPSEPAQVGVGGQVAATTSRTETDGVDPGTDVDHLDSIGPRAAQQLRSADVHTVEQLARARTKDLAAETGLHPRRVRVWVFRARRMGDW